MAHFTRVKPLGWGTGEKLSSSNMNTLDTNVSKSINGDDGGTWAPTDKIIVQGNGVQIESSLTLPDGSSTLISGAATVIIKDTVSTRCIDTATVAFEDSTQLQMKETSTIALTNTATITCASGTAINLSGTASMGFSGTATCTFATGTTLTCNSGSNINLHGTTTIAGTVNATSASTVKLQGRKALLRTRVTLSDTNQTVKVDAGDRFVLPAGPSLPAAPRTITLDHSTVPPNVGETMTFFWYPKGATTAGGTQFTFKREDATTIATFDGSTVFNVDGVWAEFEYTASGWKLGISFGQQNDGTSAWGVIPGPSA